MLPYCCEPSPNILDFFCLWKYLKTYRYSTLILQWKPQPKISLSKMRLFFYIFAYHDWVCCFPADNYMLNVQVGLSPSKTFLLLFYSMIALQKLLRKLFMSSQKLSSFSRYLNLCPYFLVHVEKTAWLERSGWFWNSWRHSQVNEQLQNTYCSISHELRTTRQCNLVS